ncbi:hypothetical protein HH310_33365 [Actinoplanes sp. TBRC 11911]|uniref:hypothetical protein n=1 Tax=Actinoplanes sp. TBRC 11911 TaxID=2729386 RepID=UPI00145F61BD|nr:hypothetical protein [Actinoplanes sp. TBRC 11911]NMO56057.1 hypothetical protein [Actinoplanes sp. TBRC 11911]
MSHDQIVPPELIRNVYVKFAQPSDGPRKALASGGSVGTHSSAQRSTTRGERPGRPAFGKTLSVDPQHGIDALFREPLQDEQGDVLDSIALRISRPSARRPVTA